MYGVKIFHGRFSCNSENNYKNNFPTLFFRVLGNVILNITKT